jgi:addiction module HigA family antidote
MISIQNQYRPTQVLPPGLTLLESLESLGMSQADLAARIGRTPKHISEIIHKGAPITSETALDFEKVLGVPSHFWLNLEQNYREFLARQKEAEEIESEIDSYREWMKNFPIKEMSRLGWLEPQREDIGTIRALLSFFKIASKDQWSWERAVGLRTAFRQAVIGHSQARFALAAWLWKGHLDAQRVETASYDGDQFNSALGEMRNLTIAPVEEAVPQMLEACSRSGVVLIFTHELPGIRVYGATRWLANGKPLIQMCLRGKSDDQFWFTFFHESAHILLHGRTDVFVESDDKVDIEMDDHKEEEANRWASSLLIPDDAWDYFMGEAFWQIQGNDIKYFKGYGTERQQLIRKFASEQGIAPGIVVGRLQKQGLIPWNQCNNLKVRLEWKAT